MWRRKRGEWEFKRLLFEDVNGRTIAASLAGRRGPYCQLPPQLIGGRGEGGKVGDKGEEGEVGEGEGGGEVGGEEEWRPGNFSG